MVAQVNARRMNWGRKERTAKSCQRPKVEERFVKKAHAQKAELQRQTEREKKESKEKARKKKTIISCAPRVRDRAALRSVL